ncbi:Mitochondrial distribution and morphology protein 10 [Scheffersomyces spartinae]|uniref:Mitochondrial distribution and morphology protein 10 n=1 Tax=Scheffersomyces spartinae TaxID=45513 RepID=A0A9P7V8D3_9ASCO|nr:Mitochondrial distribution and morphology protein 10 [Scheffersomyces spartinae]KAG7192933.1 Mitochondrial distribution and morphology protein 10 [Scheffersomyces spartinae]
MHDNIFSNVTATSRALIEFPIPQGCKVDVSSMATGYLALTFTLSNNLTVNGSLAYLYTSIPLQNTLGTRDISLQDAISGFKVIDPQPDKKSNTNNNNINGATLLYGRMYFPGSCLEAMMIKKLTSQTQLLVKCINNPHVQNDGTMIVYLQKNAPRYLREFIFSTNELLLGFRCLYNLNNPQEQQQQPDHPPQTSHHHPQSGTNEDIAIIPKFDNSVLSIGTEIWYAARSLSPGLSASMRYSTRSTSTGKPLAMTLSVNPMLGHISSTYSVKTSVASTFCSRYDFNVYSYASNLQVGFEVFNYSKKHSPNTFTNHTVNLSSKENKSLRSQGQKANNDFKAATPIDTKGSQHPVPSVIAIRTPTSFSHNHSIINPIEKLDDYFHISPTLFPSQNGSQKTLEAESPVVNETVMDAFQHLVSESDFSSVFKCSTSFKDKQVKLLWEGRAKDFLVSTGVKFRLNSNDLNPEVAKFGISFSYAA